MKSSRRLLNTLTIQFKHGWTPMNTPENRFSRLFSPHSRRSLNSSAIFSPAAFVLPANPCSFVSIRGWRLQCNG